MGVFERDGHQAPGSYYGDSLQNPAISQEKMVGTEGIEPSTR